MKLGTYNLSDLVLFFLSDCNIWYSVLYFLCGNFFWSSAFRTWMFQNCSASLIPQKKCFWTYGPFYVFYSFWFWVRLYRRYNLLANKHSQAVISNLFYRISTLIFFLYCMINILSCYFHSFLSHLKSVFSPSHGKAFWDRWRNFL